MPKDDIDMSAMRPQNKPATVVVNNPEIVQTELPDRFVPARPIPTIAPQIMPQGTAPQGMMQPTQKMLTPEQEKLLPDASQYLSNSQKLQKQSIEAQEESALNIAAIQQQQAAMVTAENERLYNEYNEKQQAYNAAVQKADETIAATKNDYSKAQIDPQRIFKGDNNNRMLAGISLALGAMGGALTGQRNYAMDMINSVIDRDIEEQRYEAQKKYSIYENAKKEREIVDARFDNDVSKLMFQKNMRLDAVKTKVEGMIAGAKSAEIRANSQQLLAQLNEQIAQNKIVLFQNAINSALTVTTQMQTGQQTPGTKLSQQDYDEHLSTSEAIKTIQNMFDKASKIKGAEGILPSSLGGKRGEAKGYAAAIGGVLTDKLKARSQTDWDEIISPNLPSPTDTPELLKEKWSNIMDTIKGFAPAGYFKIERTKTPQVTYQPKTLQR